MNHDVLVTVPCSLQATYFIVLTVKVNYEVCCICSLHSAGALHTSYFILHTLATPLRRSFGHLNTSQRSLCLSNVFSTSGEMQRPAAPPVTPPPRRSPRRRPASAGGGGAADTGEPGAPQRSSCELTRQRVNALDPTRLSSTRTPHQLHRLTLTVTQARLRALRSGPHPGRLPPG